MSLSLVIGRDRLFGTHRVRKERLEFVVAEDGDVGLFLANAEPFNVVVPYT